MPYDDDFDDEEEQKKKKIINEVGSDAFYKMWDYLSIYKDEKTSSEVLSKQIYHALIKLVGKKAADKFKSIEQLIS